MWEDIFERDRNVGETVWQGKRREDSTIVIIKRGERESEGVYFVRRGRKELFRTTLS